MNNLDKIYRVKPNYNEARLVKSGIRINEIPDEYKDKRILLVGDAEGVEKRLLEKRGFTNIVSGESRVNSGSIFVYEAPAEDTYCVSIVA